MTLAENILVFAPSHNKVILNARLCVIESALLVKKIVPEPDLITEHKPTTCTISISLSRFLEYGIITIRELISPSYA